MKIIVSDRVRVPIGLASDHELTVLLKSFFTHENPDYKTWKTFRRGPKPPKHIESWRTEHRGTVLSLPRGGLNEVVRICHEQGRSPGIVYSVSSPQFEQNALPAELPDPLWPHQERLVSSYVHESLGRAVYGGLWRAPQGSGKTQAVLALILRLGVRALVVVSNTSLFNQWTVRVERECRIRPGVIKGKIRNVKPPIVIAMAQTLAKCAPDYSSQFGLVVLDEAQIAAASTIQEVIDVFGARFRLGVSGDERRADRKEFLTYEQFGPVIGEVSRDEVERSGSTVDVVVRIVPTEFRADWYTDLSADDPSDERQRQRAARAKVEHRARLLEELTTNAERNRLIVNTTLEASQLGTSQFIVLSDRREHCHALDAQLVAAGISSGLFIGGDDYAQQFELALAGMINGKVRGAVGTYQAIGVGFEAHRSLALGFAATPCVFNPNSRMQFNQYRGRFARSALGKQRGIFYYFWDRHVYGLNPVRLLKQWNKIVEVLERGRWVPVRQYLSEHA